MSRGTFRIVNRLAKFGHLPGITLGEGLALRRGDDRLNRAFDSYREIMQAPRRVPIEDVLEIERCGCPDFIGGTLETGSGSWPAGCHGDYPENHAVTFQVDKRNMPSFLKDHFEEAWKLCAAAYAYVGVALVREDENSSANVRVTWERGRGWIGLAIVPRGPGCGTRIWAKFDTRWAPSNLVPGWAKLLGHEFGHNMGYGHTRGGIMNPTLSVPSSFPETAWLNDIAYPMFKRNFGGMPIAPTWGIYPGADNAN